MAVTVVIIQTMVQKNDKFVGANLCVCPNEAQDVGKDEINDAEPCHAKYARLQRKAHRNEDLQRKAGTDSKPKHKTCRTHNP